MILGINAFMLHGKSFEEICRITAKAGCRWISPEVDQLYKKTFREVLEQYQLNVNCAGTLFLNVDEEEESLKTGKNVICQCRMQQVPVLNVVLYSQRPDLEWMADAVALCRKLAEYGAKDQIQVAVEPLHPSMRAVSCMTQLWQMELLCGYVDHPNFGVTIDLYHCNGMKNPEDWFSRLGKRIFAIHVSDVGKEGTACFPGLGKLAVRRQLQLLSQVCPDRIAELEVVANTLAEEKTEVLIGAIRKSFLFLNRVIVVGELALHRFVEPDGQLKMEELGGGAGMIAAQMEELGLSPWLIGTFGTDPIGQRLLTRLRDGGLLTSPIIQEGKTTSEVTICGDALTIRKGTVRPWKLASEVDELLDEDCLVYLPVFPGYERVQEVASHKKKWKTFYDFGYFEWCGDFSVLSGLLETFPKGYCALLNAKDMEDAKKKELGRKAVNTGYRYAILTDGGWDVLLFEADQVRKFPVIPVSGEQCSCGAGDCLTAGILLGLSNGWEIEEALCYGIQIAYHKVQVEGIWRKDRLT